MKEEVESIVIDNGTGFTKVGFSGEDIPRSVFQTITGSISDADRSQINVRMNKSGIQKEESFVGSKCQDIMELLSITYPIERGNITRWDEMEKIWEYCFSYELNVSPEAVNLPVLLTDAPLSSKKSREQMAQVMFEVFKVPGFYIVQQCVLSLFASGRTRGLVVESGHGASHAVPVFEGYALPHAIQRMDVAGYDITQALMKKLDRKNHIFGPHDDDVVRHIKESHCYISSLTNYSESVPEVENMDESDRPYELPDGNIINIPHHHRIKSTEVLFNPNLLGDAHSSSSSPGLPKIAHQSITMCDADLQRDLYGSIVLAGGTSMLPGFSYRMHQEMSRLNPDANIRVVPDFHGRERGYNSQRKHAAWVGGSMFASLPTFHEVQISKQEWEESHETVVHRKCF